MPQKFIFLKTGIYHRCVFVNVDQLVNFCRCEVGGLQYFLHQFFLHGSVSLIFEKIECFFYLVKDTKSVPGEAGDLTGLNFMIES